MLRTILFLTVSLCGLQARSPAQVLVGLNLGKHVSVHANLGSPRHFHGGSNRNIHDDRARAPRLTRGRRYHLHRPVCRTVTQRVWCPGHYETVHVPARYEVRHDPCGRRYRVLVRAASQRKVWHPGYYKLVQRQVCC